MRGRRGRYEADEAFRMIGEAREIVEKARDVLTEHDRNECLLLANEELSEALRKLIDAECSMLKFKGTAEYRIRAYMKKA